MKSANNWFVSWISLPQRRTVVGMILTLVILIAGISSLWFYTYTSTPRSQPHKIQPRPYSVNRLEEMPASPHRAQAMVATEQPTSLIPWSIALDYTRGFTWVAEPGCQAVPTCPSKISGIIGQYALSDNTFIQNFAEPSGYTSPLFLIVDSASHIWFTQPNNDAIGEFDPQHNSWHEWFVKKGSVPYDLTFDKDGNIWFTEFDANKIGFFNTHTHTMRETLIPSANSQPYGITVTQQGNIWFAENRLGLGQIGSITLTPSGTIQITEYAVGAQRPHLITSDSAGNIWYSEGYSGGIGELNPTTGNVDNFFVYPSNCVLPCTITHISGIQVDTKGNVWFTDAISQRVGYLVPSTGQVVARSLDRTENPHPNDGLIIDSSDRVWFTEQFGLGVAVWLPSTANQKGEENI